MTSISGGGGVAYEGFVNPAGFYEQKKQEETGAADASSASSYSTSSSFHNPQRLLTRSILSGKTSSASHSRKKKNKLWSFSRYK